MNLLIFLDLTYNPCKNVKFCSLQGKNVQFFLIFTCNQGKIFLIYLLPGGCPPPPSIARTQIIKFDKPMLLPIK